LANFAKERKTAREFGNQFKSQFGDQDVTQTDESLRMIKECIKAQPKLDKSTLDKL
jgi:hypothetical protein